MTGRNDDVMRCYVYCDATFVWRNDDIWGDCKGERQKGIGKGKDKEDVNLRPAGPSPTPALCWGA